MVIYKILSGASIVVMVGLGAADNHVKKVFFHQGIFADKLVFYATSRPMMQTRTQANNDKLCYTCEFLLTCINELSCQSRIQSINKIQKKKSKGTDIPYTIAIDSSEKPSEKVSITIAYRPQDSALLVKEFQAIGGQPAIAFIIVHKKALEKYQKRMMGPRWFNLREIRRQRKIRVIVDAGHGGTDGGACSAEGIVEKDITLKMSLLLAHELSKRGFEVRLTRTSDVYVPLDERTAVTNLITNADLFISLHGNANTNKDISGLETYYLTPPPIHNEVDDFFASLVRSGKVLADDVQSSLIQGLQSDGIVIKDRGVKHAVSQVLMGVEAPAVLIEMDFVSNETAARRLMDETFQKKFVKHLVNGILSYSEHA